MKSSRIIKVVTGSVFAFMLLFGSVSFLGTTAQAQFRDRNWRDNDRRGRSSDRDWERRRAIERARAIQRARELAWRREQERRSRERSGYGGYRNYPYGNGGGGYGYGGYNNNSELERGYRNGLKEGADDAGDRDSFNPSRHSSFRDGNPSYRSGFQRGYSEGYRQYSGNRRW